MQRPSVLFVAFIIALSIFVPFSEAAPSPNHSVMFIETGLPQNLSWYVSFNGTAVTTENSSVTFQVPNGNYYYFAGTISGFNASPGHGVLTVDGNNITVDIHFQVTYYNITFIETGLPAGSAWQIDFSGKSVLLNNTSFVFREYRGSYPFSIKSFNVTYRPYPASGTVDVTNSNVTEMINFRQQNYTVTFVEQGLVSGTAWSVNVSGQEQNSSSNRMNFQLTNGTYDYSVSPINGYNVTGGNGTFTVNGQNLFFQIDFISTQPYTFIVEGLSQGSHWYVQIGGTNYSSNSSFMTLYLPNATYNYRVVLPYGYSGTGVKGTISYYNNVVIVSASDLLLTYIIIIVLVVLLDLLLVFYILRRRARKAAKQ
ncbi:MAG: hypothetical protein LVQ63_00580 [Thermoplasmatales archaeon]|nr:hypothetical protein [Thermoplasmatales archaeon]